MATNGFHDRLVRKLSVIEHARLANEDKRRRDRRPVRGGSLREFWRDFSREMQRGFGTSLRAATVICAFVLLGVLAGHVSGLLFVLWLAVTCGLLVYVAGKTLHIFYVLITALVTFVTWKGTR
jgi:Flp pilus assembly protein TadB